MRPELPMEDKLEPILEGTLKVFMRYGIKSLTMDDIARELGISKKTLYKYVADKNELVQKAVTMHVSCERSIVEDVFGKQLNAIDEHFEISKLVAAQIKDIHPSVVYDLQKYYPEAMQVFNDYKASSIYTFVLDNIAKGIEEGFYRPEIKKEIIARIYITKLEDVFNPVNTISQQYTLESILWEIFRYHIRGIATPKGVEYLVEKVKRELPHLK